MIEVLVVDSQPMARRVVLIDSAMCDSDPAALMSALREQCGDVPILLVSDDGETINRCLHAGANGFVSSTATAKALVDALRDTVASGGGEPQPAYPAPHHTLSKRELEVMLELVSGKRGKRIAFELGISEKTVSTHRARLMKKLGVSDSRALLIYALRTGLTEWA